MQAFHPQHVKVAALGRYARFRDEHLRRRMCTTEPFYSILSPQYAGQDLETHYGQLAL